MADVVCAATLAPAYDASVATYTLVSFKLCPFVQRSVITLEEKGVPYEVRYIELDDKPAWFIELSPLGKVPVLQVDETVLFESAVINEFLDEVAGSSRMLPHEPLPRARDRAWIEFASALLAEHWQMTMAPESDAAMRFRDGLRTKLERLEGEVQGPYWHGETFSLVDTAVAPLLQRLDWTDGLVPSLALLTGLPRVRSWTEALLARPSVQRSTVPEIQRLYRDYLAKPRGPQPRASWLGQQLASES